MITRAVRHTILVFITAWAVSACAAKAPQWVPVQEIAVPAGEGSTQSPVSPEINQGAVTNSTPPLAALSRKSDELAPGYLVRITCAEDPGISGSFRIDEKGQLKLAYGVEIAASGLSMGALREKLTEAYKPFFRKPPAIGVTVAEKKLYVEVQGLVSKPGTYLIPDAASLDEVATLAGGLDKDGSGKPTAKFLRISQPAADGERTSFVRLSEYFGGAQVSIPRWYGGDRLFFQQDGPTTSSGGTFNPDAIQILGEVRAPGEYTFKESGDVFYYIGAAGGLTDRADLGNMMLLRRSGDQRLAYNFTMEQMQYLPKLAQGDILFVHAENMSSTAKTSRVMSEIGQFFGSIATSILLLVAL